MATEVQVFDSGTSSWVDIDYSEWSITVPLSVAGLAPTASITSQAQESSLSAGQDVRIRVGGTDRFVGILDSPGEINTRGQRQLSATHEAVALFEETVTVGALGPPTDEDVLLEALNQADRGGNYTLSFDGTPETLGEDYIVRNKSVKNIFRDIADRRFWVWWVDPASKTIDFEPRASRGTWNQLSPSDGIRVEQFDEGTVGSVRNDVTVTGTQDVAISETSTNSTSITNWGRQTADFNYGYISSSSEAQTVADSLIVADPQPSAVVRVPQGIGGANPVESPLVNFTVDLDDAGKAISETGLLVVEQTIRQGQAELRVGQGARRGVTDFNRTQKSNGEVTEPGSTYDSGRLADRSVTTSQLDDLAVTTPKIDDVAVSTPKIEDVAVDTPKLASSAVASGKLDADAVISGKIATGAVLTDKLDSSAVSRAKIADAAVNGTKVAAGSIGTTKLVVEDWIPVGLTLTSNSPNAGEVEWNQHSLVYDGTEYSISSGSTSDKYIYWRFGDGFYTTSPSKPNLAADDALVAINDGGTANQILQATIIDGASITTGSITAVEIEAATITATEIDADTITANEIDTGTITATEISGNTITASEISGNTITASEITGDTITATEIDGNTITASEISGNTITASEITGDTITASEISSGTITATEIDVLDLDADELSVTDSGGNGVEFTVATFDGDTHLSIVPTSDSIGNLGNDSNSWDNIIVNNASVGTVNSNSIQPKASGTSVVGTSANLYDNVFTIELTAEGSVGIGSGADRSNVAAGELEIVPDNVSSGGAQITTADGSVSTSDVAFIPETDDDGLLGSGDGTNATNAWQEIHAYNRFSYTPAPVANPTADDGDTSLREQSTAEYSIDLAELKRASWDDPPNYVSQAHAGDDTWTDLPAGGVEHGHLLNYLLEVAKAQQTRIDEQADRIDDLEARISALESQ